MIRVLPVGPDQFEDIAHMLSHFIAKVFSRGSGGTNPEDVFRKIKNDHAVMWVLAEDKTPKGVAFTQVEVWPEGKVLRIVGLAGDEMTKWLETFTKDMRRYARSEGCFKIVAEGRRGWGRVLGLKPVREIIEMEIS